METTHPLRAYRERHGLTQEKFAERVLDAGKSVSRVCLAQIELRERFASPGLALAIAKATDGEIRARDLVDKATQALLAAEDPSGPPEGARLAPEADEAVPEVLAKAS